MSDVTIYVSGVCGRITLNRPKAINALTLAMVTAIQTALLTWARDASIHFVLVDGSGDRGLCAGGDIRALYTASISGHLDESTAFFREEYRLNFLIARYPKPYLVVMDRLVMGGGIGISAHGSHRIVTERSELGMPETAIGFFPDIGGTYLLARAPEHFGTYLGLTGRRIGAADALRCRLADRFVASAHIPDLIEALERCASTDSLEPCLQAYSGQAPVGTPASQGEWIGRCFAHETVEDILTALRGESDPEAGVLVAELEAKSPTSLKVTLLALRRASLLPNLAACLQQEFHLAQALVQQHDFKEGVRAAIIDKDRNPRWQPPTLQQVTPEAIVRLLPATIEPSLDLSYPGLL